MRSSVYLVLCVHVISFRLGVCGLCRHVCYSGELLLRSVQPRDYPSVPSGLPTVASLEREGPSLPYPGLVDISNSSVIPLSARFEKGIVCSSRLPLFWVAWKCYCPWVHWVIFPLSFVFFLRPLCFPFLGSQSIGGITLDRFPVIV